MPSLRFNLLKAAIAVLPGLFCVIPLQAVDRKDVLEQMRNSRPSDLQILIEKPDAGGSRIIGIYSIKQGETDPDIRSYQVWEESPADLNIYYESVSCSLESPLRVKRSLNATYIHTLNPGGSVNATNREDHLVWWAACVPETAGMDPATLRDKALSLGYSTLIPERQELLPALAP